MGKRFPIRLSPEKWDSGFPNLESRSKNPELWFDFYGEPLDTIWNAYGLMVQFCGSKSGNYYFYEEYIADDRLGLRQLVWAVNDKDELQVEIGQFSIDSCGRASIDSPTDSSFFEEDALRLFDSRRSKIIADVKGIDQMTRLIRPDWILEYGGIGDSVKPRIDIHPYLSKNKNSWNISSCLELRWKDHTIFL